MRSTLRALSFALAAGLGSAAMAQYTWSLVGTVSNCYAGQTLAVEISDGTNQNVLITADVPVDPNTCTFSQSFDVPVIYITMTLTTQCNGMVQTYGDSAAFNFLSDSALTYLTIDCGGGQVYDCNGALNGPDMPGTPCDDNDPATDSTYWSVNCLCLPDTSTSGTWDCWQIWNGPNMPGTSCIIPGTTLEGIWTPDCVCWLDSVSNLLDCEGVLNGPAQPGTPCALAPFFTPGIWSPVCLCDTTNSGGVDCLGIPGGQSLPGTMCVNFLGDTGVWSVQCQCQTNSNVYDCTGLLNGPNMPGTACDDNDPQTTSSFWNANCVCVGDSGNTNAYDCLGELNGNAMPGTSCTIPGTILQGVWSAGCTCEPAPPCQANFWVLQAYTDTSNGNNPEPVPYELWIWNLSSGGSGVYSFIWDFGDNTPPSTDPFPTHTYADNGPYNLCLTLNDANGCTSTHCDSVSVNSDGIFTGIVGQIDRSTGFTINVQNASANGIAEQHAVDGIAVWPNPVVDELNIALVSSLSGAVDVTVTDLNGRVVIAERNALVHGKNQLLLNTSALDAGIYLLRIGNGTSTTGQRFVKTR